MSIFKKSLLILFAAILALSIMPIRLYAEDTVEPGTTEETQTQNYDVSGDKTASPTELTEESRKTTVTLSLPSGEYENKVDLVFVMDDSTSSNEAQFATYTSNLFDSLDKSGIDLKVSVIKFRGYASDMLEESGLSGLTAYKGNEDAIIDAIANNTVSGRGSNAHSGLVLASKLLEEDTEVPDKNKYVIFLTDGRNYIWNNSADEPTTFYSQYLSKHTVQMTGNDYGPEDQGKPVLNQLANSYNKELGASYNTFPPITDHTPVLFVNESGVGDSSTSDTYKKLYDSTNEELTGSSKYDAPAYYSGYYSSYSGNPTMGDGTVEVITPINAVEVVGNGRTEYHKVYVYTPEEGTFWESINYQQISPYELTTDESGNVIYDTSKPNEDFFLWHPTNMEKGLYITGHFWIDEIAAKYNTCSIGLISKKNTGSGRNIAGSFVRWLQEESDFSALIDGSSSVEDLFDDVDRQIRYMVAKGTVTDTIPEEFTLVETEGTSPFTMTKAGETLTPTAVEGGWAFGTPDEQGVYPYVAKFDGKDTITWEINVPIENTKQITLSYDLEIDLDAEVGKHNTNVSAAFEYVNSDGKEGTFTFPVPEVNYTTYGNYVVRHFLQNLDGESYPDEPEMQTDPKKEITGTEVSGEYVEFEGFTPADEEEHKETIVQGDTVFIDLYYTRNKYTVTYEYTGKTPSDATELPKPEVHFYGETVTVADNATADGYVFSGWSRKGEFEMPADNVVIQGSFKVKGPDTGDATDITSWMIPVIIMNVMGIAVTTVFRKRYVNI